MLHNSISAMQTLNQAPTYISVSLVGQPVAA